MLNKGFVKINRSILEWEWYNDFNVSRLFIHLILKANYEPKKWKGIMIQRGQLVTSIRELSDETGLSVKAIRIVIEKLKKTGELTTIGANNFTVLTINNYGCFQDSDEFEGQTKGKQKGKRRANEIDDLGRTKGQTQNDSYDIDNQSNMSKSESEKGKQKGKQVSNNVDDLGQTKGQQLKNIKNKEINIPTLKEFQEYAISKKPNVDIDHIKLKYDAWTENDWMDGNNKKIINWKTTLLNTLPYLKETQTKPINNPFTAPITF